MEIVIAPAPGLRQVCKPCDLNDPTLKQLSIDMANTMYENSGVGLAGPQVGVQKRCIVIDCNLESNKRKPIFMVNPELLATDGEPELGEEGCLSIPGISVEVLRPPFARVKYFDVNGKEHIIEGDGLLGRCLQHEIDHINGITLFESCIPSARLKAIQDYNAALKAGAKPGQTGV